jgi:glucose/arabinose dehydrogenase
MKSKIEINRILTRWVAIALLLGCVSKANAQVSDSEGCSLAAWVMQQQPHSTRTLEAPPPVLRDTILMLNGSPQNISIPAGFTMTVFANNLLFCRGLACSPDGVIYATAYDGDVYALPDHNHDGVADSTIVVASGLNDPHGIGFYNGQLYVSNDSALYRFVTNGVSRIAQSRVRIASLPTAGGHHSRNFVIDSIKGKIYLQIGSNGNLDTTDVAHRAQIVEMNLDGSDYHTYATGVRNAVGMDVDPRTDALWVNNNGMDNLFEGIFPDAHEDSLLTDNNPSESVYLVCDGANYGWPYCYGFQLRNPQQPWVNLDANIVQTFDGPVAELLAHSAPLGLHFYRGTKFPSLYHNVIFQCYHGSWDRTPPAPPRITVMWADTDGKNARVTDFVNGFEVLGPNADSNTSQYFGRPVSIIEGADSALYVSDDLNGVVYRIAYTGAESSVAPSEAAVSFHLADPVPNPATNTLSAELTLGLPANVRAEVFDEMGNTVQTIMDGEMNEGEHELMVDTSKLSSGSYILRVTAGGEVVSRSFIIER